MKKISVLIILAISMIGVCNAQVSGATDLDQGLQVNGFIANTDTTTGTTYSSVVILNSYDPANEKEFVNFQAGAHILVVTKQVHDSVNAVVYLQVGNNISSGTEGKDYGTILIDSLLSTRKVLNISLLPYINYQQARLKVVAFTGVAVGGMAPTWSATFGGQGKLGKLTDRYKAASVIR